MDTTLDVALGSADGARAPSRSASSSTRPIEQEVQGQPGADRRPVLQFVRSLRACWNARSIRTRLLVIVLFIDLAAALVAGAVTILMARTATRVEIAASTALAELLVNETVRLIQDDADPQQVLANLPLELRLLRHVRISLREGSSAAPTPLATLNGLSAAVGDGRAPVPRWFQALIAPPSEEHVVPITAGGQRIGSIVISEEPGDEITEVWENTVALAGIALAVNVAILAALYVLFGRALAPLGSLDSGLRDLERRNYDVRLPRPKAREFAALTDRFNALAEALGMARTENVRLSQRLIGAQDEERKRTALELHDEVGPSLFGLKVNASSIITLSAQKSAASAAKVAERARDMQTIVEHLQSINRSLLNRLRPMALGQVPLRDLVADLVRDRSRQHPDIRFASAIGKLQDSYGDSVDLTIYRCVQESLTNAIRHASAGSLAIELEEMGPRHDVSSDVDLRLVVRDDGRGIEPDAPRGFGLSGMQERVQALGGTFMVESAPGRGTSIRVVIPISTRTPERDATLSRVGTRA